MSPVNQSYTVHRLSAMTTSLSLSIYMFKQTVGFVAAFAKAGGKNFQLGTHQDGIKVVMICFMTLF